MSEAAKIVAAAIGGALTGAAAVVGFIFWACWQQNKERWRRRK